MARIPAYRITEAQWLTIIGGSTQVPNALYFVEINTWLTRLYETDNAGTPNPRIVGGNAHKGAYAGGTTYLFGDLVRENGAVWFCKVSSTIGNAPPSLPTTSNTQWELYSADGIQSSDSSIGDEVALTTTEYAALTPDAATIYFIYEDTP